MGREESAQARAGLRESRLCESQVGIVRRFCLVATLIGQFLLPAAAWCGPVVTYVFSGAVRAVGSESEDAPIEVGDRIAGSITFDSGARLLPPQMEDDYFWTYHPTGIFRLSVGEHTWFNTPDTPCAVWMHIGWPMATFWCPTLESDVWPARMRLDFWDLAGGWNTMSEPYPKGPFNPADFREMRIGSQLTLMSEHGVMEAVPILTDVRFTSEPGMLSLISALALSFLAWRRTGLQCLLTREVR